ncbi:MAG: hypothetical protein KAI08_15275 [Bacteroidales bacterium]|nr:hypothetical protein [Bacteroidales bacterium]
MKKIFTTLCATLVMFFASAQEGLDYFLPGDVTYDLDIPTPEQFFKQQLGEWHLTHEQVLNYMNEIANISGRAIIYEYARSYENKPLVHLVFTSPENHENLDELKTLHSKYSNPDEDIPIEGVPLVVSLTYGVHGNESSGPNASVLTAYHLAAAQGEKIDKLLGSTIIIVDPCLNPDGFTRHSTWANMHQSAIASGDNNSRQFYEGWPSGRTNHYWFDLNRDYLLLVNPESKGRVAKFHEWKPNVVTDHHESSPNTTFFFQPGVPSRNNPLIPVQNFELTSEIATYHARYLDAIGSQYFSEESFDDYYFGKGSTYPDINAGIGILFEASSIRGRIRETSNGLKKLSLGIKNQFTVSLSTLEASMNLHDELLNFQREFYKSALGLGEKSETKAYLFGSDTDKVKTQKFVDFLNRHQIEVYKSDKPGRFIVPVKQKQFRLLTSIFEEVTSFKDTAFYDVSTWTFTHAFDIPVTRLTSMKDVQISDQPVSAEIIKGKLIGGKSSIAYLFRWNEYSTPEALYLLQDEGLITKVATKDFSFNLNGSEAYFTHGTILVPVPQQELSEEQIFNSVSEISEKTGIDFYGLTTGLSPHGIDMGSGSFSRLEKPEILMFTGGSTSSYLAGEIWHLFDQNYHIPITNAPSDRLSSIDINRYNNIILPGGSFKEWSENNVQKLLTWVENGGILIVCKDASKWAGENELGKTKFKEKLNPDTTKYLKYNEREKEYRLQLIGGAILKTKLDVSHPLCYGYLKEDLAIIKRGTDVASPLGIKYSEPVTFDSQPYLSGWVSEENLNRIKEAPVVSVQSIKKGKLISYHEDLNFRGIWLGTNKLFSNSVFFGGVIR